MEYKGEKVKEINIKMNDLGFVSELLINGKKIDCNGVTEFTVSLFGLWKQSFIKEVREWK